MDFWENQPPKPKISKQNFRSLSFWVSGFGNWTVLVISETSVTKLQSSKSGQKQPKNKQKLFLNCMNKWNKWPKLKKWFISVSERPRMVLSVSLAHMYYMMDVAYMTDVAYM